MKKSTVIPLLGIIIILGFLTRTLLRRGNQSIPLGYDPGLYKSLFLEYYHLGVDWNIGLLPTWIRQMYPPLLGMQGATALHILGGRRDRFVTRGRATFSMLPLVAILGYICKKSQSGMIIAGLLFILSFTQYQVFWRNYEKQAIAIFLAYVCGMLWEQRKYNHSIPLLVGVLTMHETTGVWLGVVGIVYGVFVFLQKKYIDTRQLVVTGIISGLIAIPLLFPFWHDKIQPLIAPLLGSIGQGPILDGYQAGGTFLTVRDYLGTAWYLIIAGLVAITYLIKNKKAPFVVIATIVTLLWIGSGGFFYQRMIGYADISLIAVVAVMLGDLFRYRRGKAITTFLMLLSGLYFLVFGVRMSAPIIEVKEFDSIKKIDMIIETGSIIVVPGIWYTPWIKGRTKAEVLAPGMFDLNLWGTLGDGWTQKWINQDIDSKCKNLLLDYPEIKKHPSYLRIGSKQYQEPVSGLCFELIYEQKMPDHQLYRINTTFISEQSGKNEPID